MSFRYWDIKDHSNKMTSGTKSTCKTGWNGKQQQNTVYLYTVDECTANDVNHQLLEAQRGACAMKDAPFTRRLCSLTLRTESV